MVCGDSPIEKEQQSQELLVQNNGITMMNSILNNC